MFKTYPGVVKHQYLSNPMGARKPSPLLLPLTNHYEGVKEMGYIPFSENAGEEMIFPTLMLGLGLILDKPLDLLECQFLPLLRE